MGSKYVFGYNPLKDYLLQLIITDSDVTNKRMRGDIYAAFIFILQNVLNNENDVIHLDFDINGDKDHVKLVGNNAITALWLSGIFPINIEDALTKDSFLIGDIQYTYNKKSKRLTHKFVKK